MADHSEVSGVANGAEPTTGSGRGVWLAVACGTLDAGGAAVWIGTGEAGAPALDGGRSLQPTIAVKNATASTANDQLRGTGIRITP
jgi:hypothetical protein